MTDAAQKALDSAFDLAGSQTDYLAQLIKAFPDITAQSLAGDAEAPIAEIISQIEALDEAGSLDEIMRDMRRSVNTARMSLTIPAILTLWCFTTRRLLPCRKPESRSWRLSGLFRKSSKF